MKLFALSIHLIAYFKSAVVVFQLFPGVTRFLPSSSQVRSERPVYTAVGCDPRS